MSPFSATFSLPGSMVFGGAAFAQVSAATTVTMPAPSAQMLSRIVLFTIVVPPLWLRCLTTIVSPAATRVNA